MSVLVLHSSKQVVVMQLATKQNFFYTKTKKAFIICAILCYNCRGLLRQAPLGKKAFISGIRKLQF